MSDIPPAGHDGPAPSADAVSVQINTVLVLLQRALVAERRTEPQDSVRIQQLGEQRAAALQDLRTLPGATPQTLRTISARYAALHTELVEGE
ncbi:hypothetical protein G5C51_04475 [Streptomyces sp. A7024]|uniref:Uncharacterized protein n=1 Tax=Streptomyces coryli TaxID=1128680 RepID=A0A6G4TTM6_9ACTN|nr:hypothetical protein [Streptomyces coryli]NGN63163.1 hypothetical protein [Streptomyces coryli]